MRLIKILGKLICLGICFWGIWMLSTGIFTHFNPNYVLLEDGKKGYIMNTENLFYGFFIAFGLTLVIYRYVFDRRKK